jgi:hypothetical protein
MTGVTRRLGELFDLCETSWRALEAAGADDEMVNERRDLADELAELVHEAGGKPVSGHASRRARFSRGLRLFVHFYSREAYLRESARSEAALVRAYERAFDAGLPLELSSALLQQLVHLKRQQWTMRSRDTRPQSRPRYAPLLPSLRERMLPGHR